MKKLTDKQKKNLDNLLRKMSRRERTRWIYLLESWFHLYKKKQRFDILNVDLRDDWRDRESQAQTVGRHNGD